MPDQGLYPDRCAADVYQRLGTIESIAAASRAAVEATLSRIEEHLENINARLRAVEVWQAATGPSIESMLERVASTEDKLDAHGSWIDQQKGGMLARIQILSGLVSIFGIVVLVIKLLFFHS